MNALAVVCRLWPSRRQFILIRDHHPRGRGPGATTTYKAQDPTAVPAVLRKVARDIERDQR